jgi:hypothetical protein
VGLGRPGTTGTDRKVIWIGDSGDPIPTDGTTAGGDEKAAPGDLILYS